MGRKSRFCSLVSLILVVTIVFQVTACSSCPETTSPVSNDGQIIVEDIKQEDVLEEDILNETILTEYISEEIYLQEVVLVEQKITELLLEEDIIEEVYFCSSIYVPEESIEEFAENSQTKALFGENIDWNAVLTKIAIGTGVIVTVIVLKKANLPDKIASVVVSAADKGLKAAGIGAGMGTLYGGLMGFADGIDESGRTAAVLGFSLAVVGLVISALSLAAEIPSGGLSSVTLGAGVKIAIAGIALAASAYETVSSGVNMVKTLTTTEASEIDWDNVDWDAVGVSAAEQSIEGASNGYMWGAIIGTVYGGAEGYDFYSKYSTPYSTYNARLVKTPAGGKNGYWTGQRGESTYVLNEPIVLPDGTKITSITYKNAVPDFSPYAKAQVTIPSMTNKRYGSGGNFEQADEVLAAYWDSIQYNGQSWTARDVELYRSANKLTWHEMNNMTQMQLVPTDLNAKFGHLGGCGEYNAMIGQDPDYFPDTEDVAIYDAVISSDEGDNDDG